MPTILVENFVTLSKLENALIPIPPDKSNGYEAAAERFMSARNPRIGAVTVRRWSQILSPRCSVLDLGCGNGVPVSQTLIEQGLTVKWRDALTDRESISLGTEQYQRILRAEGLVLIGEQCEEGDNYYYLSSKV